MREPSGRSVSLPAREIQRARTQVAILRDRLTDERARTADLWLRALVAETPLADRAYRTGLQECLRIERALAGAEDRLARLEREMAGA